MIVYGVATPWGTGRAGTSRELRAIQGRIGKHPASATKDAMMGNVRQPDPIPADAVDIPTVLPPPTAVHPVLATAFAALDREGIVWALLRGADDLARPAGDVDVLVDLAVLARLDAVLAGAGLRRIAAPGRGSHRFYFSYDAVAELWLELDVVSELTFGPYQDFPTPLAQDCLSRRRHEHSVWRLAPDDEAWLLLLHLLLDKGGVPAARRRAARDAADTATSDGPVATVVDRTMGRGTAEYVLSGLRVGDADRASEMVALLHARWPRPNPLLVLGRQYAHRAIRRFDLSPPGRGNTGLLVAVMGPDGAGKTTLAHAIRADFPAPTAYVHMGIWRRRRWDWLAQLAPGGHLVQTLFRVLTGSAAAQYHRRRGRLVLLDRSVYDGQLPNTETMTLGGRISLAALQAFSPTPDVVLFLDAPGELMFARKGEHSAAVLEERRRGYQHIAASIPGSIVLDATASREVVRRRANAALWTRYIHVPQPRPPMPLDLWRRLDWRFLLPCPQLNTVVCAGIVDEELVEALRVLDSRLVHVTAPSHWGRVEAGSCGVAVLVRPTPADLEAAMAAVRPGGWIYAEIYRHMTPLASGPRSLRGWLRAFERAGLEETAAHWHAPSIGARSRIVPLESKMSVRDALNQYHGLRFGWSKSMLGKVALLSGLFPIVVPEGSVLGRRPR